MTRQDFKIALNAVIFFFSKLNYFLRCPSRNKTLTSCWLNASIMFTLKLCLCNISLNSKDLSSFMCTSHWLMILAQAHYWSLFSFLCSILLANELIHILSLTSSSICKHLYTSYQIRYQKSEKSWKIYPCIFGLTSYNC